MRISRPNVQFKFCTHEFSLGDADDSLLVVQIGVHSPRMVIAHGLKGNTVQVAPIQSVRVEGLFVGISNFLWRLKKEKGGD